MYETYTIRMCLEAGKKRKEREREGGAQSLGEEKEGASAICGFERFPPFKWLLLLMYVRTYVCPSYMSTSLDE